MLSQLSSGATYFVRVLATNAQGISAPADAVTVLDRVRDRRDIAQADGRAVAVADDEPEVFLGAPEVLLRHEAFALWMPFPRAAAERSCGASCKRRLGLPQKPQRDVPLPVRLRSLEQLAQALRGFLHLWQYASNRVFGGLIAHRHRDIERG